MTDKLKEQFRTMLREEMPNLVREHPDVVLAALGDNPEALGNALRAAGFEASVGVLTPGDVRREHQHAVEDGRMSIGFGISERERASAHAHRVSDPASGKTLTRYIRRGSEEDKMAERWLNAFLSTDKVDPSSGESLRSIYEKMQRAVRAPSTPLTGEAGTGGAVLIPTLVAAQIFMEMTEKYELPALVTTFVSAAPLRIPRRIRRVSVSRGLPATDISESNIAETLGSVELSPNRVSAMAYLDPEVIKAAVQGPVAYTIGLFAEAMAEDHQRTIVAGTIGNREPRGISTLPTSGGDAWDRAKTAAWTDTSRETRRNSLRTALYALSQIHRQSNALRWIMNADAIQVAASLNDTDQTVFRDGGVGQNPALFGRPITETGALLTSGGSTTILLADMGQYAWQESPGGISLEQTSEGGKAWESDTIGVKMVQRVDGAPIIPPAFCIVPSVVIP